MISSEDVRRVTFEKAFQGYRRDDVDDYLKQVAQSMDELAAQNDDLQKKLVVLAQRIDQYRAEEDTLRTTMINAQRLGENVIREAKQKAAEIIRTANIKAEDREQRSRDDVELAKQEIVTLKSEAIAMDNVVVVGYGVQKKASITGAITNISGDALKVNSTVNTSTALAGTIAGINSRMSDGRPGATTKISIRGMDSPLYIIDGVQRTEAQFNNIDANDIESVSILKDASASAIYGSRGANGVILVTTKSAAKGQTNISVKHQTVISQLSDPLDIWYDPMLMAQVTNEEEISKMINEGKAVFYIGFDPTADSLHVGHFMALCLMKRLQMAGNKPIALIGGGTTMIGDPSGRTDMRK